MAHFHRVEFSDRTGNPLLLCENVAMILNRMLRKTKVLLSKIRSLRKILLSGNQSLGCIHIKSLFLRACCCLRKRAFVCFFPFRLICSLDSI